LERERLKAWLIVAANNHYAGLGTATANMFRVMSGRRGNAKGNSLTI